MLVLNEYQNESIVINTITKAKYIVVLTTINRSILCQAVFIELGEFPRMLTL